nr:unnamed protein product [Digitaria exilis]
MERGAGSEQGSPESEMGDGDNDSVGYGAEMEVDAGSGSAGASAPASSASASASATASAYAARAGAYDGVDPFEGMEFDDEEDAWTFYNVYAHRVGFSTRISVMHRSRRDGSVMSRQFVCAKEGFRTYRGKNEVARADVADVGDDDSGRGRRTRAVTRVGCKAMIRVKKQDNGRWTVTKLETAHNHPLVPANQAHCLRPHKPLSECGKQRPFVGHRNGGYISAKTDSQSFIQQYEKALDCCYEKEVKEEFETKYSLPDIKTSSPIEKQGAELYTRHILAVFAARGVSALPSQYFVKRWTKHAMDRTSSKKVDEVSRAEEPKEEQRSSAEDDEQSLTWRYNSLCREALSVNTSNSSMVPGLVTVPIGLCLPSMDGSKISAAGINSENSGDINSNGKLSLGLHQPQPSAQQPSTPSQTKTLESIDSRANPESSSIRAAAIAAGARIASPSDAASIIKATQSKDAIRIRPGENLPNYLKTLAPKPLSSVPPVNTPNSAHASPGQRSFGDSAAAKDAIFGSSDGSDDDEYDDDTDDEDEGLTGDDAEHE